MSMYPALSDVDRVVRELRIIFPARMIFEDTAMSWKFLNYAFKICHGKSQHRFIPADELRAVAESFIGRHIRQAAFLVALSLTGRKTQNKNGASFPLLHYFEDNYREMWKQKQESFQQEIDEELAGFGLAQPPDAVK